MNDPRCTQADVDQAGEELIALGRKACALHINDGVARLSFMRQVDAFVDEIVQDVVDGVISAQEGLETLWEEYEALRGKVGFYMQNGITVAGGAAQVGTGVGISWGSSGVAVPLGGLYVSHGLNNIYEGAGNIHNGSSMSSTTGPLRKIYQDTMGGVHEGNILYGINDLGLSVGGLAWLVRKPNSFQLFRQDLINYTRAFRQMSKPALTFEIIVNIYTIQSMKQEEPPE
ncbi:Protein of unknown function [Pseudomonas taetrolens]|uniref:DUF4225 domain-containing protein n=1 Tax=Pseudomonas taetrolens TaxID=47884 RepID=A0A0J6GR56_PSETA|nr:DUF4225 domain-containing protein [Pseudomonas taetrolens]KMM84903.1 hypothetical protein TU78_11905 [Pseudomonas taetrolens]SEB43002.1 Protein of unknown function [Pseudomonas taetrolens]SQF84366.1 Uncharacterised protein [Pseudomonas taetrolens]VEH45670.1 Uncharacterised protein [Pseudomonas taetrolens]